MLADCFSRKIDYLVENSGIYCRDAKRISIYVADYNAIIVGILLLVAELVLLPGISVAGIGAFLSLAVAAVYGFFLYGILGGSVVLAAIIIVAVAAVVVSLRANTWQRLSLKSTIDATSTPTPEQNDIRIGQRGETLTRLAPMGKVQVGDVTVEAKSVDAYIDPRQVVEVIGYDNTAVVVRRIAAQERAEERPEALTGKNS